MRNLLQNKVAVAFLLVTALALVGLQFNLFTPSNAMMVAGRQVDSEQPGDNDDGEPTVTNTPPRYLTGLRDWQQTLSSTTLRRDPFRPLEIPATNTDAKTGEPSGKAAFNLQAISQHDQRRFAVVDGVVIGEGDKLAGFRVVQIDPGWVLLRDSGGIERRLQLHLDFNPAPEEQRTDEGSDKSKLAPGDADPK